MPPEQVSYTIIQIRVLVPNEKQNLHYHNGCSVFVTDGTAKQLSGRGRETKRETKGLFRNQTGCYNMHEKQNCVTRSQKV